MGLLSKLFGSKPTVDYSELIANGAKIIDVRSPGEYKSGHSKGSLNFPLNTINENFKTLTSFKHPLIIVCRSGNRASSAKKLLEKQGVECYNAGAWQNVK